MRDCVTEMERHKTRWRSGVDAGNYILDNRESKNIRSFFNRRTPQEMKVDSLQFQKKGK